jgi:hypothetical protein
MQVVSLWIIYIIFVFVIWFLFWHPGFEPCVSPLSALFYALLLGFLFIYLVSPAVNTDLLSDLEKSWYEALLGLALILPLIIVGLAIIYIYERVWRLTVTSSSKCVD